MYLPLPLPPRSRSLVTGPLGFGIQYSLIYILSGHANLEGDITWFHVFVGPAFGPCLRGSARWTPIKEEHPIGDYLDTLVPLAILPLPGTGS
jgi:hypothetical protein